MLAVPPLVLLHVVQAEIRAAIDHRPARRNVLRQRLRRRRVRQRRDHDVQVVREILRNRHVHRPQVQRGLTVDDPLRHHLAHTAGGCDAVGVEAGGDKEVGNFGSGAHEKVPVRGEGLRPVDELAHADGAQHRSAHHGRLRDLREVIVVGGQQLGGKLHGHPVHIPGNGVGFVSAHSQGAHLGLVVHQVVWIPHGR